MQAVSTQTRRNGGTGRSMNIGVPCRFCRQNTVDSLRTRVQELERELVVETLADVVRGRIVLSRTGAR